jgi:hypothetical protein
MDVRVESLFELITHFKCSAQWPALKTHLELINDPVQKLHILPVQCFSRAIHGHSPGFASNPCSMRKSPSSSVDALVWFWSYGSILLSSDAIMFGWSLCWLLY